MESIKVLVKYDNEDGPQEIRYDGFLTDSGSAMYVIPEYGTLIMVNVEPTDEPNVYLDLTGYVALGVISDETTDKDTIEALAKKLHGMTAYEFMTRVIVYVMNQIEFEDWIIPKLLEAE